VKSRADATINGGVMANGPLERDEARDKSMESLNGVCFPIKEHG